MNFDAMMHIFCVRKNISRLINKMMIKMNVLSASDFFFLKDNPLSNLFTSKVSKYAWLSVLLILGEKLICYSSLMKYEYFIQSQDISF